jgi:hypothetical protein
MNDGFFDDEQIICEDDFIDWFYDYPDGTLAVYILRITGIRGMA